jgi:hypothetical protein
MNGENKIEDQRAPQTVVDIYQGQLGEIMPFHGLHADRRGHQFPDRFYRETGAG